MRFPYRTVAFAVATVWTWNGWFRLRLTDWMWTRWGVAALTVVLWLRAIKSLGVIHEDEKEER